MSKKAAPPRILVIRFSSIGDIVLTTPILRCLKQQLDAEVHFLTKKAYGDLLAPNPHIDKLWLLEDRLSELLPALRRQRYDRIVDLHNNLRSLRVKLALRRPARSFPKLNREKWLLTTLKIDRLPRIHIVERYFRALRGLSVQYDSAGLDHFFPANCTVQWRNESVVPDGLVSLAIGGAHATKRLPEKKLRELCRVLNRPLVLLGGPAEAELGARLEAIDPERIYNVCGHCSLHQSARWIEKSAVLITHDTGMMHLGAALKKPILSVWGNTVPAFGMYPLYPTGAERGRRAEVDGLSCRPCSKIGHAQCPRGHFRCMQDQDPRELGQMAEEMARKR